jgi:endonuclease YncB( thermonuclease family)
MRKPAEFANHPHQFPDTMEYRAFCRYVVDGDTFDFIVDLGIFQYTYTTVRLSGIDTPEIFGRVDEATRTKGKEAKARVESLILNKPCTIVLHKDKVTFGRFVADVFYYEDGIRKSLKETLLAESLGVIS